MTNPYDGDPGDEQDNGKSVCSICGEPLQAEDLFICAQCSEEDMRLEEERDPRGNEE